MPDARLEVTDSLGRRVVPLNVSPFRIGRRDSNELRLAGAEVSRDHAEIVILGDDFILRDKQSRYGTFVNGEQVIERRLNSADCIRLGRRGDAELVFLLGDDSSRDDEQDAAADLRQVAALLEGLRALGSGRVLNDVLALVLDSAIEVAGAERGFIMLPDELGELEFKLARARGRVTLSGGSFATSRKIPEEVFATGDMRIIPDLLDRDLADADMGDVALGIRHIVCAPLNLVRYLDAADAAAEAKRIGVLYLDSREKGHLFSASTRSAIETLATEAAVALENARLYRETVDKARLEQEMRIAADIQQALLRRPQLTQPFVDAAAASIPCRSIGADFYDHFKEQRDLFTFMVGDVAGKGPPAALLGALMQGMCGLFVQDAEEPALAVASMNKALCVRRLESRFVSLVFGVLSSDGVLTYCNAGYNPPIVLGPTGARRLQTGGPILGLFESAAFDQETIQLDAGDVVIVFSDGVSEATNTAGEQFGDAPLQAAVAGGAANAEALVERIVGSVQAFAQGTALNDDITVMVVRYLGEAP